jgi:uncharacterized SAM-binding protein YcdF (DUF218 family)
MRKIKKIAKVYLILAGILAHIFIIWMGLGWPFFFDRWLIVSQTPMQAEAIVCLSGGIYSNHLPVERGYQRIYTAVQLYADGWAPQMIFSGGGSSDLSEGEIYAEVAGWLGLPQEDVLIDAFSGSTAEHPENILNLEGMEIHKDTPLLVVTSPLHSRRAHLCFRKAGFSNFRIITGYEAQIEDAEVVRSHRESEIKEYKPSGKKYDDFFIRMRRRSTQFWEAVREYAAIGWYKIKGEV